MLTSSRTTTQAPDFRYAASLIHASQRLAVNTKTQPATKPFACRNVALATTETWVKQVANYRTYCLDGANCVVSAEWIEADDDGAAIEIVKDRHDGHKCELWDGRRLVARVDLRRQA